jgi:cytochrome c556
MIRLTFAALALTALVACSRGADPQQQAAIEARIAKLEAAAAKPAEPPELGQQMLELQLRHARLWSAGQGEDWTLVLFQVTELGETAKEIVATNPDHAALQPARLAEVMPPMLDPAFKALRDSADHRSRQEFEQAYDQLSAACTACHTAASHDFLVIGRPTTPTLDNLKPTKNAATPSPH